MEVGIIGLGRMGMNMARRLLGGGHRVVVYNRTMDKTVEMKKEGAIGTASLEELVQNLGTPRVAWMMLPAGKVIDEHVDALSYLLSSEDLLVDGGNTHYKDDLRRAEKLKPKGIHYVDAGVSGGIWGLKE